MNDQPHVSGLGLTYDAGSSMAAFRASLVLADASRIRSYISTAERTAERCRKYGMQDRAQYWQDTLDAARDRLHQLEKPA